MKHWIDELSGRRMCGPNCADEWLHMIWAIGSDYDGCLSVQDLRKLIDELVDMSQKARSCLRDGKIFPEEILEFKGRYFFLSNFFPSQVFYNGKYFRNAEAAFQSEKCPKRADEFCELNPSEAKKLGRRVTLRNDWEEVKDSVMYEVCLAKFTQNQDLAEKLVSTGDAYLVEGNTWGDKVWGVCNGIGENRLGKIIMMIRDKIR